MDYWKFGFHTHTVTEADFIAKRIARGGGATGGIASNEKLSRAYVAV